MNLLDDIQNPLLEEGAPAWVVTFGDLMSLLLCFFVLLLSFSEMDKAKYKEVSGSLAKAFGVQRKIKAFQAPKGIKMISRDFDQELIPARPLEEFIAMQQREKIGTAVSYTIEYLPGSFVRVKHIQHKYACRACSSAKPTPSS